MAQAQPVSTAKPTFKVLSKRTTIPGGDYTAVQNRDGTWTIKHVPIFSEVGKDERGNEFHVGRKWMERALAQAKMRAARKYYAPLHIHHHEGGDKTIRAGCVIPQEIAGYVDPDNPKRIVATMFADLAFIPDRVFQAIDKGELLYRSVEVIDWKKPEISSLALLQDEVPFFKYPHLTIGKKLALEGVQAPVKFSEFYGPALSHRAVGRGSLILFCFRGGKDMKSRKADPSKKAVQLAEAEAEEKEKKVAEAEASEAAEAAEKKADGEPELEAAMGDEERPEAKNPDAEPPWASKMVKLMEALAKKMGISEEDEPWHKGGEAAEAEMDALDDTPKDSIAEAAEPVEQEPAAPTTKVAEAMRCHSEASKKEMAKMAGRIAAMELREQQRAKAIKIQKIMDGTIAKLADRNLDASGKLLLHKLVVAHGEEGAKSFLAFAEKSLPKDPDPDFADGEVLEGDVPQEVMEFQKEGPDRFSQAQALAKQYGELNGKSSVSLKRFIELNMRPVHTA